MKNSSPLARSFSPSSFARFLFVPLAVLLASGVMYEAEALDPTPDYWTLIFPTLHPQNGQNGIPMAFQPGDIRYSYETQFEDYWMESSYYNYDPQTGQKRFGWTTDTKTFGYAELPWTFLGGLGLEETVNDLNEDTQINWTNPDPSASPVDELNEGVEVGIEPPIPDDDFRSGRASRSLIDGVFTPGEDWQDEDGDGHWDAEKETIPSDPYWNLNAGFFTNICGTVRTPYGNSGEINFSPAGGELFADYNDTVGISPTDSGYDANSVIWIADPNNPGVNIETTINELDLTPRDCPNSFEGDWAHTFVPGTTDPVFLEVATNGIPRNGRFDYTVDADFIPQVEPAIINGVAEEVFYEQWVNREDGERATSTVPSQVEIERILVPVYRSSEVYGTLLNSSPTENVYGDLEDGEWNTFILGEREERWQDFISWYDPFLGQFTYIANGPADPTYRALGFSALADVFPSGSVRCQDDCGIGVRIPGNDTFFSVDGRLDRLGGAISRNYYNLYIMWNYCGDWISDDGILSRSFNGEYDGADDYSENRNRKYQPFVPLLEFPPAMEPQSPNPELPVATTGYRTWSDLYTLPDGRPATWQNWYDATFNPGFPGVPQWVATNIGYTAGVVPHLNNLLQVQQGLGFAPGSNAVLATDPTRLQDTDRDGLSFIRADPFRPPGTATSANGAGWHPELAWTFDGPQEFADLPSSLYHLGPYPDTWTVITNIGTYVGLTRFVQRRMLGRTPSGDTGLGEYTSPFSMSHRGQDLGDGAGLSPNSSDGMVASGGPFAINVHGNGGLDAADMEHIELMTRRWNPFEGSPHDWVMNPALKNFRDGNLDGMVDGAGRATSSGYGAGVNDGDASTYPFNRWRYMEDVIEVWDSFQDYEDFRDPNDLSRRIPLYTYPLYPNVASNGYAAIGGPAGAAIDILTDDTTTPFSMFFQVRPQGAGLQEGGPGNLDVMVPGTMRADFGMGLLAHEMAHDVHGWPDLYDYDVFSANTPINSPVAAYDLMSGGGLVHGIPDIKGIQSNGANLPATDFAAANYPQPIMPGPWHQTQILSDIINCPNSGAVTIEMYPVEDFTDNYFIWVRPGETSPITGAPLRNEYYYFYYQHGQDDFSTLGGQGIMLTHTDLSQVNSLGNSPRQQRINDHFTWEVIPADGSFDLQDGGSTGDTGDPFPGVTEQYTFSPDTFPPARWWDQTDVGLRVLDIVLPDATTSEHLPALVTFECYDPSQPWSAPTEGADRDQDGILDLWEFHYFTDDLTDAGNNTDADGDGLNDLFEFLTDSDPNLQFTDPTNPLNDYLSDFDNDLISNGDEQDIYQSDPSDPDTDDDGFIDGSEVNSQITIEGRQITSPTESRSPLIQRSFDLQSQAVPIPDPQIDDTYRFLLRNFTIEMWVKTFGFQTGSLFRRDTINGQLNAQLRLNNNIPEVAFTTEAGVRYALQASDALPPNTWVHLAAVFDDADNKFELYQNGELLSESIVLASPATGVGITTAGGERDPRVFLGDLGFNALVDEVRIWSVPQEEDQIARGVNLIANSPGATNTTSIAANDLPGTGLVAYYRFDDGQSLANPRGAEDSLNPLNWEYAIIPAIFSEDVPTIMGVDATGQPIETPAITGVGPTGEPIDDLDGDGVPDWWQIIYFPGFDASLGPVGQPWSATSDPDGDFCTNADEYEADTNPSNAGGATCFTITPPEQPPNVGSLFVDIQPPVQQPLPGADAVFIITVSNTSPNITLFSIELTNSVAAGCNETIGTLAPGASTNFSCTAGGNVGYTNFIIATGLEQDGGDAVAFDSAIVLGETAPPSGPLADCPLDEELDGAPWVLGATLGSETVLMDTSKYWFCQSAIVASGAQALQVGGLLPTRPVIGDNETSFIQTTVNGPGQVCFAFRISSEFSAVSIGDDDAGDLLRFLDNGVVLDSWSGESSNFFNACYDIGPGLRTIRWEYKKDARLSVGTDAAWLDNIQYTAAVVDTDGDGLLDSDEINIHMTDPNNTDTDGDGLNDAFEVNNADDGFDPLNPNDGPTIRRSGILNGNLCLEFEGIAGVKYQVEKTFSLANPVWFPAESGIVPNTNTTNPFIARNTGLQVFYDVGTPDDPTPPCYRVAIVP